ncbi:hypothetical protein KSP40_PGU009212 [Platanthera guangdongensis]|uniref:ABC1 atypical kinase-like domain-containing protein n=1 Tax=Platanthera guangdongensis TaxID=2320717 RepID=A0ABR2LUU0_9ASPA
MCEAAIYDPTASSPTAKMRPMYTRRQRGTTCGRRGFDERSEDASKDSRKQNSVPRHEIYRNAWKMHDVQENKRAFIDNIDGFNNLPKLVEDIVQTSINTGPRGATRLAQGIQAVIGVGGEWLNDLSKNANASSGVPIQMQLGLFSPLYLRKLFERMGATYIKLGQFIASTPTLFPAAYVEEFKNCFDRAPAVPFNVIEAIMSEELGRPLDSIYEYIDPVPIASASVAQVHGARLRNSQEEVVIKVLKPNVEDTLVADLNFIYIAARIFEFLSPGLQRTSLVGVVEDIKASMLEEVDFRKEAVNIESFRRYLKTTGLEGQAKAPRVYQYCSTRRVLTMERLYGVPLTDLDSITSQVPDPEMSLITALNVWFGSLIACETFHADVHAGNLWLLHDGRIGFLDFGIVGRISPQTWGAMEIFLASFASEDYKAMASALIEMGATGQNVDVKAFGSDLKNIFASIQLDDDTRKFESAASGSRPATVEAPVVTFGSSVNLLFNDPRRARECYGKFLGRQLQVLLEQGRRSFHCFTRVEAANKHLFQLKRFQKRHRRVQQDLP